ncbi:MAG TPA: TetR/AcrR family transcriptional regulator [Candidatus Sulfotelmatobacter sp.]|nr:TetR/AcrR family transcriptional regulator [Candidatus Sulfotelmatobacter sp.]
MPMTDEKPKWNRRKDERPAEILGAAIDVFAERGFAAARLDEVAQRAGVVKGTLYRYFATKEEMFKAVVHQTLAAHLETVEKSSIAFEGSLVEFVPMLLGQTALTLGDSRFPSIARVVLTESRTFPDLAAVWHDELVARMLNLIIGMITKAQQSGEVRPGDPKLYAFSILRPMVTGVLFHEVFGGHRATAPDLKRLASQHAEFVLRGLLVAPQKEGQ